MHITRPILEAGLLLFSLGVAFAWFVRLKETLRFLEGSHIIDSFSRASLTFPAPKISVIIPARNEEENIGQCLESLLHQDYPDYEIIVVDDRSTDKTPEIVQSFIKKSNKIRLISVKELVEGWTGKNHALHAGVQHATGSWFLFTDADTTHSVDSLSMSMGHAFRRKADMFSLTPSLANETFWEKVIQPAAGAALMMRYPLYQVNDPASPTAFGNGQYILIKKEVYQKVGGHEAVKDAMLEDIFLARLVKQKGYCLHVGYGVNLLKTRMYANLRAIWNGWTRIYYSALGRNPFFLFTLIVLLWLVSLSPYFLLFCSVYLIGTQFSFFSIFLFGSVMLQFFLMFPTLLNTYRISRSDTNYIFFHFLACLVLFGMFTNALCKILFRLKVGWRGRSYVEHW